MIMADVLKIFLLVLGLQIVLVSYWLAAESLFPRLVSRAQECLVRRPVAITLLGAVVGTPLVTLGLGLLQAGSAPAKGIGFVIASATIFGGLLGSAALCRQIGQGLPSPADAAQPWRQVLRGAVLLALMSLLPFAGWFLVLPLALASGLGAALAAGRSLRRESRGMPGVDGP